MTTELLAPVASLPEHFKALTKIHRTVAKGGVLITPVGLDLDGAELTSDEYEHLGLFLGEFFRATRKPHDAAKWALGDFILFGEATLGEKYAQAMEATGRQRQTLMNYASVANRVPRSRRRETLTFTHHQMVASLDPRTQTRMLDLAEKHEWSSDELANAVRAWKAKDREGATPPAENGATPPVVVEVVVKQAERVYRAATRDGDTFRVPVEDMVALGAALGYGE